MAETENRKWYGERLVLTAEHVVNEWMFVCRAMKPAEVCDKYGGMEI